MTRQLKYYQAILEATDQCMSRDQNVYVMGLGVTDPKGTFGTTLGLETKYGSRRIMDMPTSENGMTGIAIGSAIVGMRPIMTHQRLDFALLSLDQIINNAAKWHYMFGGRMRVPLVIRLIIGRGWGQGPQHSQSLQALFAHVPGLKVVMPTTPHDAKGLLAAAVEDDNPVIFLEHRWLHNIQGPVPEPYYVVPIGKPATLRAGRDITIVSYGYMALEALRAADLLALGGIEVEVIDVRTLKPFDASPVIESIHKTGRLLMVDHSWRSVGFGAEVVATVAEQAHSQLKNAPRRLAFPDVPTPTSPALANQYYPRVFDIVNSVRSLLGLSEQTHEELHIQQDAPLDVPDTQFTGPF